MKNGHFLKEKKKKKKGQQNLSYGQPVKMERLEMMAEGVFSYLGREKVAFHSPGIPFPKAETVWDEKKFLRNK